MVSFHLDNKWQLFDLSYVISRIASEAFRTLEGRIDTNRISTRLFKASAIRLSIAFEWPS
jgi:hypothetical protein